MEIANKYANGEEEIRQKNQQHRGGGSNSAPNPKPKAGGNNTRKAEHAPIDAELVEPANASGIHGRMQPRKEWQPRQKKSANDGDVLDQPCPLHTTRDAEGKLILPKHTARQCRLIRRADQNAKVEPQEDKNTGKKKAVSSDLDSD